MSCAPATVTTIDNIPLASILFIARLAANIGGVYMVDNGATIVTLVNSASVAVTFTDYTPSTGGTLNLRNGSENGFFATILCP